MACSSQISIIGILCMCVAVSGWVFPAAVLGPRRMRGGLEPTPPAEPSSSGHVSRKKHADIMGASSTNGFKAASPYLPMQTCMRGSGYRLSALNHRAGGRSTDTRATTSTTTTTTTTAPSTNSANNKSPLTHRGGKAAVLKKIPIIAASLSDKKTPQYKDSAGRRRSTRPTSRRAPGPAMMTRRAELCDIGSNAMGYFFNSSTVASANKPHMPGSMTTASSAPSSFMECFLLHAARINGSEYGVGVPVDVPVVLGYFEGNELRQVDRLGGGADVEELLVHIRSQLDLHDVGIFNTPVVMTLQSEDIEEDEEEEDEEEEETSYDNRRGYREHDLAWRASSKSGGHAAGGPLGGTKGKMTGTVSSASAAMRGSDLSVDEVVRLERIDESLDDPGSDEEEDEEEDSDYSDGDGDGDEQEDGDIYMDGSDEEDDDNEYDEEEDMDIEDEKEVRRLEQYAEKPWSTSSSVHHKPSSRHGSSSSSRSTSTTPAPTTTSGSGELHVVDGDDIAEDAWVAHRVRSGEFDNLEEESRVFGWMNLGTGAGVSNGGDDTQGGSVHSGVNGASMHGMPNTVSPANNEDQDDNDDEDDDTDGEVQFRRDHRRADRIVKHARDVSMLGSYRHRGRTYHLLRLRDPIYVIGKRNAGVRGDYHFSIVSDEAEAAKVAAEITALLEKGVAAKQPRKYYHK